MGQRNPILRRHKPALTHALIDHLGSEHCECIGILDELSMVRPQLSSVRIERCAKAKRLQAAISPCERSRRSLPNSVTLTRTARRFPRHR